MREAFAFELPAQGLHTPVLQCPHGTGALAQDPGDLLDRQVSHDAQQQHRPLVATETS